MTEKDLDVAIEKCERIMEMDTRTMQNPVSENGWIFERVYDLLQYLRQFQFATDTNVGGNLIDRQAALDAIKKLEKPAPTAQHLSAIFDCEDTIKALPSAQPVNIAKLQPNCNQVASDVISRQAALDALTEWYDNDDDERSAKDVIRELPQEQQWSCGKPKHIGRYIVTYWSRLHDDEQCRVQIMRFQNGHWVYPRHIPEWINGEIEEEVLAWCKLPTPYREGGQE